MEDSRRMQIVSAVIVSFGMTIEGAFERWPFVALPILKTHNTTLYASISKDVDAPWIAIHSMMPSFLYPFLSCWLLETFGRKFSMLASSLLIIVSWIPVICAKSALHIIIPRIVAYFGLVTNFMGCILYIAETVDSDIRERLALAMVAMKPVGNIIAHLAGLFESYVILSAACLAMPLVFLILLYFVPESPYYLIKSGKLEKARNVLKKLSPKSDEHWVANKIVEHKSVLGNIVTVKQLKNNKDHWKQIFLVLALNLVRYGFDYDFPTTSLYYNVAVRERSNFFDKTDVSIISEVTSMLTVLIVAKEWDPKFFLRCSVLGCYAVIAVFNAFAFTVHLFNDNLVFISFLLIMYMWDFFYFLGIKTVLFAMMMKYFTSCIKRQAIVLVTCETMLIVYHSRNYFCQENTDLFRSLIYWGVGCFIFPIFFFLYGRNILKSLKLINTNNPNNTIATVELQELNDNGDEIESDTENIYRI